jgi:hypothetical protein
MPFCKNCKYFSLASVIDTLCADPVCTKYPKYNYVSGCVSYPGCDRNKEGTCEDFEPKMGMIEKAKQFLKKVRGADAGWPGK